MFLPKGCHDRPQNKWKAEPRLRDEWSRLSLKSKFQRVLLAMEACTASYGELMGGTFKTAV